MGVDWVPARPRADANAAELQGLIAVQAARVQARLGSVGGWSPLPRDGERANHDDAGSTTDAAVADAADVDERLLSQLDVVADEDGTWWGFRVYAIVYNRLLPTEWRKSACTTLLPEDAAEAVARWRWWYGEITAGRMRHYLQRLFTWDAYRDLRETQAELAASAAETFTRTNAWTRTERFLHAREQVLQLPDPPRPAPPGPPPRTAVDDAPTPDQEAQATALTDHIERVAEATRAFNRTVPSGLKSRYPDPLRSADEPLQDPWLEEFFAWVTPVIDAGQGLYLWE